jgi:Chaperone of endosialidase
MSTEFNFPANPTIGDIFTLPNGSETQWNGTEWALVVSEVVYPISVDKGGTNAITAPDARINLGLNTSTGEFIITKDGNITAPGLAWESDLELGLYRKGINQIGTAIAGSERFSFEVSGSGSSIFNINKSPATVGAGIKSSSAGLNRWLVYLGDQGAETGNSAGSNIAIFRYEDTGVTGTQVLSINRVNGFTTIGPGTANIPSAPDALSSGIGLSKLPGVAQNNIQGFTNGLARWNIRIGNSAAETGSDIGSDFEIARYSDTGSGLGSSLTINRASGGTSVSGQLQAQNVVGGGSNTENNICPSGGYLLTSVPWPNINGGFLSVRGNANGNYPVGAVSVYSGSSTTGVYLPDAANSWVSSSDERLKNIIDDVTDGLESILAIRPIRFRFKSEAPDARLRIGVTAQSVKLHVPEIIDEAPRLDDDFRPTVEKYMALNLGDLVPHLISAIKTLNERLIQLENK